MAFAANYRVLVIPDNLSAKPVLDSFIYEESSEYFANQIINKLNLFKIIIINKILLIDNIIIKIF